MLSKAHLASHSRMSGCRWLITTSWLSGSLRSFLYSFSVCSCHLVLISSAPVGSLPFLSFIEPIFEWNVPLVSPIFLKRSLVFPYCFPIFLCIVHLKSLSYLSLLYSGTLHLVEYIFSFLLCLLLLFSAILWCNILVSLKIFLHYFFVISLVITLGLTYTS